MTRQEQPEILDRRSGHHVVEIQNDQTLVQPIQDIASVAVAVDPLVFNTCEQGGDEGQGLITDRLKIIQTVRRNQTLCHELLAVFSRGCCRGADGSMRRRFFFSHLVDPSHHRSQAGPVLLRGYVEGSAGAEGEHGEVYPAGFTEGRSILKDHGRNHRELLFRALLQEAVFL